MKIPLLLLSHVGLGLAGWWAAREFRIVATAEQAENPRTRSARPRPPKNPGNEIVRSIELRLEKAKADEAKLEAESNARVKILAALTGLVLPEDPAAAIGNLLTTDGETTSIQAAALFVLWAKSDPTAALEFASTHDEFSTLSCGYEALELVGEFIAPELALAMPDDQKRDSVFDGLARQLIANRTVEQLTVLLTDLAGDLKSSLSYYIGDQWPTERLNDFGRLATAIRDPDMLRHICRQLPTEEMANWMKRYADKHPDPDFARKIRESDFYFALLRAQPAIPLEDRLDVVMKNFSTRPQPQETIREDAMKYLTFWDVSSFFDDDGPDLHYAYHHGKIEASELLTKLTVRFPEHAAAGRLPVMLYQELAPHDPDRAAFLIAELPAEERARVISESSWLGCSWDTIGRAFDHLPDSDEDAVRYHRMHLWEEISQNSLDYYGKDYLHWILSLPDPLDRKLALGLIADEIEGTTNEEYVAEIREIVGDIPLRDTP